MALPWSCNNTHYQHPTVKIKTLFGDIYVELYPDKAPKSVAAFLANIDSGIYKDSKFYRVLKSEDQPSSADKVNLIQGGINYTHPEFIRSHMGIPLETTKESGLKHENGTISFARSTALSSPSEFFICIGNAPSYDYGGNGNQDGQGFAAFGKVIKGMGIVRKIHEQSSDGTTFTPPISIRNIIYLNPK